MRSLKIEYETNLNNAYVHIYVEQPYEEDYQIQMLRKNKIEGILLAEGCEIEGQSRYTYEISGFTSMQKIYEKQGIKKEALEQFIRTLLDMIEKIQNYMLEPNNLVLHPECIFQKNGKWYFCYIPGKIENTNHDFHQLSEYFVRAVDYKDTESILLAYEFHKASFQENYNLRQIIEEYEKNGKQRNQELEVLKNRQNVHENIFSLSEEEGTIQDKKRKDPFFYDLRTRSAAIRESDCVWQYRTGKGIDNDKNRWGRWDDLMKESAD